MEIFQPSRLCAIIGVVVSAQHKAATGLLGRRAGLPGLHPR
jgi:hypothetical protein